MAWLASSPTMSSISSRGPPSGWAPGKSICEIDLPGAQPEEAKRQIEDIVGLDSSHAILASAKEGTGVHEILEAILTRSAAPEGRS